MGIQQLHQELRAVLARPLHISALTVDDRASVEVLLVRADHIEAQLSPYAGHPTADMAWIRSVRALLAEETDLLQRYSELGGLSM